MIKSILGVVLIMTMSACVIGSANLRECGRICDSETSGLDRYKDNEISCQCDINKDDE